MQHLKALRAESVAFLNNGDHGVINDFDAEPGYLIVKGFSRSEPPPVLSLLIGEALYQMRAALDGLACELAEANGVVVD